MDSIAHVRAVAEHGRATPQRRPLLVFDALEQWMLTENPRPCLRQRTRRTARGRASGTAGDPGAEAVDAGLPDRTRPRRPAELAGSLFVLLEGATVAASLGVLPGAVADAGRIATQLLESAV
ncbi:hypothetical protein [Amycolatopsis acididurans]|uniref:hypothetical protein n=1 Tax=Amycolatopsis acididurans TaxID=2724524 RepID=UPI001B341E91|nr:hypothetical protein [Amycolatopsis acididurans]